MSLSVNPLQQPNTVRLIYLVDEVTGHAKGTLAEQYLLRIFPNETKLILKVRHTEAGDAEHVTEVRNLKLKFY